ncbi:mitochondrial carrier domain-containing protein [Gilbertella persicaria]|uniref:mitochondrial carrier domain-containing protein n=1 Tax=Gilbertella persicaria TaxID=101096 RepID=UPI00221F3CC8|nr:mitochondrial carrier domain-containing protein [Gilbertella persicaria]KAI8066987.1 mitochondrial carrier domain-containing protein [Gilbertella persicaria]
MSTTWSIQQLFGLLDHNQDGLIDTHDLVAICASPNTPLLLNKNTLLEIQTQCDTQSHRSIPYTEFASLLSQNAFTEKISSEQLGKIMNIVVNYTTSPETQSYLASDTMKHLIAGGFAGAVSRTVVSPMERMKILFQVQGPNMNTAYTGIWSTLARMWHEEGWRGFMRGNGTNVIRMIPYSASQFAAYEQFKSMLLEKDKAELDTPRRLIAGAFAGTVSVACTYPLDLVRTRLSIQSAHLLKGATQQLPGIMPTMQLIYQTEGGIRGLYRGLWPTTLGVAPYVALNFQCYEVLKEYLIPIEQDHGNIRKLFCGALAGSIAQTIIYPLGKDDPR